MPVAVFKFCCCCIELRTGCLIYGYLELIGTIYTMISILSLPESVRMVVQEMKDRLGHSEEFKDFEELVPTIMRAVVIVVMIMFGIKLIFTITLLVGLHKNKRGPIGAYLIYFGIFILVSIIFISVAFGKLANEGRIKIPAALWVHNLISFIFTILLSIYFWMVIRSHYLKMNFSNDQNVDYRA